MTTLPADLSSLPLLHPEQMLTTEQLAAITGISRQTFEGWRHKRKKGGPKLGPEPKDLGPQIVRYRWADVQAWINGQSSAA